jgi:energy-coupling factor transporter ATP-binding protein EcfA2
MDPLLNIRCPDSVITCIGRRGSGKSSLFNAWLYAMITNKQRYLNKGNIVVFTSTGRLSNNFSYLPRENVKMWDENVFLSLLKLQARKIELLKRRADRSGRPVTLSPLCICLDDVQQSSNAKGKQSFYSKALEFAYTCGRHLKIMLWCNVQNPTTILQPCSRNQTTHLVISGAVSSEQLRACYRLIDGVSSFKQFASAVASLPRHCFLVFDTTKPAGERFQFVKAQHINPKFLVRIAPPPQSKNKKKQKKDKDT